MRKPTAVAHYYRDNRAHKQRHHQIEQHRRFDKGHIDIFVVLVDVFESGELFHLLDKRLDDGDSRECFLSEVGKF